MVKTNKQPLSTSHSDTAEFAKIQIGQAIETFRIILSLGVQLLTVLVLADITVIGYAVSTQTAGIFFIGAMFPFVFLYIYRRLTRMMLPIIFSAISLEQEYGTDRSDWLATTFLKSMSSTEYVDKLKAISAITNQAEKAKQMRKLPPPSIMGGGKGVGHAIVILFAIGQIVIPLILITLFEWKLF